MLREACRVFHACHELNACTAHIMYLCRRCTADILQMPRRCAVDRQRSCKHKLSVTSVNNVRYDVMQSMRIAYKCMQGMDDM